MQELAIICLFVSDHECAICVWDDENKFKQSRDLLPGHGPDVVDRMLGMPALRHAVRVACLIDSDIFIEQLEFPELVPPPAPSEATRSLKEDAVPAVTLCFQQQLAQGRSPDELYFLVISDAVFPLLEPTLRIFVQTTESDHDLHDAAAALLAQRRYPGLANVVVAGTKDWVLCYFDVELERLVTSPGGSS